mmetsp:Transcript_35736/g.41416  ORF Transcript_35736/g.41416 Transcript_35736/m.41416 type:complete len:216 (+) Transcript_35736:1004-1651(+)
MRNRDSSSRIVPPRHTRYRRFFSVRCPCGDGSVPAINSRRTRIVSCPCYPPIRATHSFVSCWGSISSWNHRHPPHPPCYRIDFPWYHTASRRNSSSSGSASSKASSPYPRHRWRSESLPSSCGAVQRGKGRIDLHPPSCCPLILSATMGIWSSFPSHAWKSRSPSLHFFRIVFLPSAQDLVLCPQSPSTMMGIWFLRPLFPFPIFRATIEIFFRP